MDVVERLSLEAARARTLLACTHHHRYRLAAEVCAGRRVVDLCCGSGYGSAILRERCPEVLGVDLDVATVDLAQADLGTRDGLSFRASDAVAFLEGGGADDHEAIVCFEGIEHVPALDRLTAQLVRQAERGTVLVLSIPNSRAFGEDNAFHVTDFGAEEFDAFAARFPGALVLRQYNAEGSVILADETEAEGRVVVRDTIEPEWANHFLLIVNAADGIDTSRSAGLLQADAAPLHNRYVRDLEEANHRLMRENARLMRGRLGHHAAAAGARLDRLRAATTRIEELEARLEALESVAPFLAWDHLGGWHYAETDEHGVGFRWSEGGAALSFGANGARRPRLRVVAHIRSFLQDRTVSALTGTTEIARVHATPHDWSVLEFEVPAGTGTAQVTIQPDPASDPAAVLNPTDPRHLGIALADSIVLVPVW